MDEEEDGDSSNERSAAATEKSGSLPFDAQEKDKPTPNSEAQANLIIFQCYK